MIDVNEYLDRTQEVRFPDKVLHVYEPSHSMYLTALQHEDTDEGIKFIDFQMESLMAMLNRNKEGIKVKKKELEDLPRGFIVVVYRALMMMCNKSVNDPN